MGAPFGRMTRRRDQEWSLSLCCHLRWRNSINLSFRKFPVILNKQKENIKKYYKMLKNVKKCYKMIKNGKIILEMNININLENIYFYFEIYFCFYFYFFILSCKYSLTCFFFSSEQLYTVPATCNGVCPYLSFASTFAAHASTKYLTTLMLP